MTLLSTIQYHSTVLVLYSILPLVLVLYSILPLVLCTFYHTHACKVGLLCCSITLLTAFCGFSLRNSHFSRTFHSISFFTVVSLLDSRDIHIHNSYCRMVYHLLVDSRKFIEQGGVQAFKVPGNNSLSYSGTM